MVVRSLLVRAFLATYLTLLLVHVVEDAHGFRAVDAALLLTGIGISLYAHSRAGIVLYALICLHMGLEWAAHGIAQWEIAWPDDAFALIHIGFDVIFLGFIVRMEWPRSWLPVFLVTLAALAGASLLGMGVAGTETSYDGILATLQFVALGGVLGCTGFHVLYPFARSAER